MAFDPLEQALYDRAADLDGVVHDSDRGTQYLSIRYLRERLRQQCGGRLGKPKETLPPSDSGRGLGDVSSQDADFISPDGALRVVEEPVYTSVLRSRGVRVSIRIHWLMSNPGRGAGSSTTPRRSRSGAAWAKSALADRMRQLNGQPACASLFGLCSRRCMSAEASGSIEGGMSVRRRPVDRLREEDVAPGPASAHRTARRR